jgi:hypothetical protein
VSLTLQAQELTPRAAQLTRGKAGLSVKESGVKVQHVLIAGPAGQVMGTLQTFVVDPRWF